ncbi:MAG: hypothetical protein ACYTEX_22880 [Planctomycetota bacterium]
MDDELVRRASWARCRKTDDGQRTTDDRGRETDDGGQTAEDGGQKTEPCRREIVDCRYLPPAAAGACFAGTCLRLCLNHLLYPIRFLYIIRWPWFGVQ